MADKIKKFFAKKKADAKFKLAGPGRKLNSEVPSSSSRSKNQQDVYRPPKRNELSAEAKAAADAALARVTKTKDTKEFNTSLAAIQAQVRRELEAERKAKEVEQHKDEQSEESVEHKEYTVQGVFFRCPLVSDEILPRKDWKVKIKDFLYEQLSDEKGLTACLIIYNCNTKEKAEQCVETMIKYLENIQNNPNEEKYKKIRMSNRIFCDKVRNVEGAMEFLAAAGFQEIEIDNEPFLIFSEERLETPDQLTILIEALKCSEPIHLELDRNIQVLLPSQVVKKTELPPEFFRVSAEELKREQQLKTEAIEQATILQTKAMRERQELRVVNRYKFSLLRVRFPDGVYLQGTFNVYEKLSQVHQFVLSCLQNESAEFSLISPTGQKFSHEDYEKSLYDLRLVPTIVFNFLYENEWKSCTEYLKAELMMLIQSL
uniref:Putative ubiquitin regulatory protein n=1 Tax=Corethrella appendiculata TaxID=1370023 RepID=U5EUD8_9DIPT